MAGGRCSGCDLLPQCGFCFPLRPLQTQKEKETGLLSGSTEQHLLTPQTPLCMLHVMHWVHVVLCISLNNSLSHRDLLFLNQELYSMTVTYCPPFLHPHLHKDLETLYVLMWQVHAFGCWCKFSVMHLSCWCDRKILVE